MLIKKRDIYSLHIGLCILFFFTTIVSSALSQQYYDFHFRHLSVITPWILSLFFIPLKYINPKKQRILVSGLFVLFIIPWSYQITSRLYAADLPSKSVKDIKKIMQVSQQTKSTIVLLPNMSHTMPENIYQFYKESLLWYAVKYNSTILSPVSEILACQPNLSIQPVLWVDITNEKDSICTPSLSFIQAKGLRYIESTK